MSDHHDRPLPRGVMIALAAVVAFTIVAVAVARLSGFDPSQGPSAAEVASRDLRFIDVGDGHLDVYDVATGTRLERLAPDEDGFIFGLLRTLERERRKHGASMDAPYRVTYREDGHFTLEDRTTAFFVELRAFGSTNERAVGRFLTVPQTSE